jgi:hypothetical protein
MNEKMIRAGRRYGELAFVAVVTACLLALVAVEAAEGPASLPGAVLYALAAGFGLEFVSAVWTGRGPRGGPRASLHR